MTGTSAAAEAQHVHVLKILTPHVDVIAGGASRQDPVSFIGETWGSWLEGTDVAGTADAVLQELGGAVNRSQIAKFALNAVGAEGRMRLLLATLMWGRGKSNGRMRHHIVKAVTYQSCDSVLEETQSLASDGDLAEAHRSWSLKWRMPGLGEPFFTKWFWASTLTLPSSEQALILDGRVWNTLGSLDWNSLDATAGDRHRARRYEAYVEAARRWAEDLTTPTRVVTPTDIVWGDVHGQRRPRAACLTGVRKLTPIQSQ